MFRFKVVANMVRSLREGQELFAKLTRVTDRFLDTSLELVACVPYDTNLRAAVRKQKLIVEAFPSRPPPWHSVPGEQGGELAHPEPAGGHLEFFLENLLQKPVIAQEDSRE